MPKLTHYKSRAAKIDGYTVRVCVAHLYLRYRMARKAKGRFSLAGIEAWNALQSTKEVLHY